MKISTQNITFKGYDAAPLKRIYIEQEYSKPFEDELKAAAKAENIRVATLYDNLKWIQDDKFITEKAGGPFFLASGQVSENCLVKIRSRYKMPAAKSENFLAGGNMFIGKLPNGEKWLLSGKNNTTQDIEGISKTYNVPPENIHFLPQQNYHLDMFMRPVGYPFVLVNDPKLVLENIEKLDCKKEEREEFKKTTKHYYKLQEALGYSSVDATVKKLEELGFIPIRIAGDYGESCNFMNAIVNKHEDGKISYITNSTNCGNKLYSSLEQIFADDLRKKVPFLDKIYFIKGKSEGPRDTNYMMDTLLYGGGGIHCMTLEEPNFKAWA